MNTATCKNMDKSHKHNVEWKKSKYMFYYSFYVSLQKQTKRIYGVIIRITVTFGEREFWDAGYILFSWSEC